MLKELMIPTTMAVAFAVTPLAFAGSDGSEKDGQQTGNWSADTNNISNEQFDELDTNQDGSLDEDELNTWGATAAGNPDEHTDQVLERYDHNDDHRVTMEELQDGPMKDDSNQQ